MTNTKILRAALLATSSLVAGGVAPALAGGPWGEQVIVGQATITRPNAKETLITQSSSKALIDWTGFSIPSGSLVDFKQPGSTSLTVNRVTGPDASEIDGELLANGAIWLLNSNGILFGRGSQVNVGALLATTSDISDDNVESGHYAFSHATNPNAAVVNLGTIKTKSGGSVVLSAPEVANRGLIQANLGTVQLGGASAFSVDMDGDNLIRYQITTPVTSAPKGADGKTAAALVSNSGTIVSTGGKVLMTASAVKSVQDDVINNTGIVEATSVASHDGEIDLDAGPNGTVDAGGTLNVSGTSAGETGGTVAMTGNTVHVENGATINASGADGGGTVLIGGGFHGKGPIANAETTLVGKATINVSATGKGNGGKVAVWSNQRTVFAGRINAKGGAQGGNGGYIETSSEHSLQIAQDVLVDASAPHGSKGTWLLDPLNIIIETGGTTQLNNGILGLNVDPGKTDTVDPGTITAALKSTNVLLEAANDITVLNDVIYSSLNSLLLLAEHDIYAYANVQNTMASGGGGVYFIAGWDGKTTTISQLTNQGVYGNNNGSIFIGTTNAPGNVAVGSASGTTVVAGDDVTVEADNGYAQIGYSGSGGGNIEVLATGNIDVSDLYALTSTTSPYALIGNGGVNVSGNIGGSIDVQAGGSISVTEDNADADGPYGYAVIGNLGGANSSESGDITVDATGALTLTGEGLVSVAQIGNGASVGSATSGGATGNITISSGDLSLLANGTYYAQVLIGDGGAGFSNNGTTGGNIDITASSLELIADTNSNGPSDEARIANRSGGNVSGNYDIAISGDIVLTAADGGSLAAIGSGENGGNSSGNIDVTAGGSITIEAAGEGESRISSGGASDTNITVTAGGDITLLDDDSSTNGIGSPSVFIGNFSNGGSPAGGNITVTSTGGSIDLEAIDSDGDGANVTIGNTSGSTTTSGTITLSAPKGDILLESGDSMAFAQIGNNDQGYTGSTSGDISVTAGGTLDIEGGANSIIGNEGTAGDISGSVTLTADSVDDIYASLINDIPNGNFTVDNRGTGENIDTTPIYYSSPYTFSYTTGGELIIEASFQNSGTGAINVKAGEDIEIGGPDAAGDVSVGSHGGTTTITAADLIVEADNGLAQLGYAGAGGGDINVNVSGEIIVDDLYDQDTGFSPDAQIGNGGINESGVVDGNITLKAGGDVIVLDDSYAGVNCFNYDCNEGFSIIGNMGGSKTTGNIVVDAGSVLEIVAAGPLSDAQIGNIDLTDGTGDISGNITISAGDVNLLAESEFVGRATIGDDYSFSTTGTVDGNIDITADSLTMESVSSSSSGFNQARITTRGEGDVFGNVDVNVSGDITLIGDGAGTVTEIGDGTVCETSTCGTDKGDMTIDAGGAISLLAENGGGARFQQNGGVGNNITVTAAGDITLETTGTGGQGNALIVDFESPSGGGDNIDVTSTHGSVQLIADAANSGTYIGSSTNGLDVATSGNISISAAGDVSLSATGQSAYAQIGNQGYSGGLSTIGDVAVTAGDAIDLGNGQVTIGSVGDGDISGSVTLTAQFFDNINSIVLADLQYGNFTIDDLNKNPVVLHTGFDYSSPYALTGIFAGNVTFLGSIQNSGSGDVNITSAGTVTIGGSGASGGVAIGSRYGTTTVDAASLLLDAVNGYAQLGFDGNGSGAIDVTTTGGVTLDGGAGTGDFAQIGDGGYLSNGSNNDDITLDAGGNVTLAGGSGQFAYAQIGNGGAEADQNSSGYTNTGLITVSGENVILDAGSGNAAYAQIGNGGYELGKGLTGQGTNSGDIIITAVDSVTLNGNGTDAYAQIGNGGDLVNFDAAAGAGGGDIGDITVTVEANGGSVALTAGNGNDSYVQIGDGGYGENTPNGNPSNFLTGGDIVINSLALALTGSNNGENAYAQIGNGDAAQSGDANVEGNITVEGFPTTTSGTASGGEALLGNATGTGTVVGTTGGGGTTETQTVATIVALTQDATSESADTLTTFYSPIISETPELETETLTELAPEPQGPLAQMASSSSNGDSSYEGSEPSDELVGSLGQSLDPGRGHKKNAYASVRTLIPGVLKQIESSTSRSPRGVPPADEDYSSWGNKELWR